MQGVAIQMRKFIAAFLILLSSQANAQIEITHEPIGVLPIETEIKKLGDLYIVRSTEPLVPTRIELIHVATEAEDFDVKATDQSLFPVELIQGSSHDFGLKGTGRFLIQVDEYGQIQLVDGSIRRIRLDSYSEVIEVGDGPGPGPGPGPPPGPGPDPDGAFDGLAAKVAAYARRLTSDHRSQISGVLSTAADKMRTYEFRVLSQATEYIARNWPPCTSSDCKAIWDLVGKDAENRQLSWQETQDYYRTVAKGVLQ